MTKMFKNAIKAAAPNDLFSDTIIPDAYDIGIEDATYLYQLVISGNGDKIFRALRLAFTFGFVMGNRATHSRKLKRL